MITKLEVFTPRVNVSPLPSVADGTEVTDPIQIRNIDGLGPVNAAINTTQYGSHDDASYDGSTTGQRNIVLTVGLNPNWSDQTPESLRQMLYKYFMPKQKVTLRFTSTHMATVQIDGYVESFTINPFSKDPEYIISIICPKSKFVAVTSTVVTGVTVALPDGAPTDIEYQGSLPTGFVLTVSDNASTADMTNGQLRVINDNPDTSLLIVTGTVSTTKSVEIGTEIGNKYVQSIDIPTGVRTSLLASQTGEWIQLEEGTNNFRVASAVVGQTWSLEYYAKYGGL